MEKKKNRVLKIVLIVILILFSISMVEKTFQNDTFTLISIGNKILEKGIFDTEETILWHEGMQYNNWEWLFSGIITVIYNSFGFAGIYAFVMIMSAITILTIFFIFQKRKYSLILSFFSALFIAYCLKGTFAARAQIISNLILVLEYYFINKLLETNNKKYSFIILLLGIVMANVHEALYPMFMVIFLPYLAEIILSKFKTFPNKKENKKIVIEKKNGSNLFIITMLLALLCIFVTPLLKLESYTAIFQVTNGIYGKYITELKPMILIDMPEFYIIIMIAFAILAFTKTKIRLSDALFILGYGILSCTIVRNYMYFAIFGMLSLTRLVDDCLKEYKIYEIKINSKLRKLLLGFIIIVIVLYSTKTLIGKLKQNYLDEENYCPKNAANYLIANYDLTKIKLYNNFNVGAYLGYRGIPVFIDSRTSRLEETMNDFVSLATMSKHYNEIFNKYNITHVLTSESSLIAYMSKDTSWKLVYQDDTYCIFEK